MPISDNNPERRNLVITSLAFVSYYLGGGKLVDNSVKLPFVNIEFENIAVLVIIAWIGLIWFFIRYQQLHSGKLNQEFTKELISEKFNNPR